MVDVPFGLRGFSRFAFWWAVWTFLGLLQAGRLYMAYYSDGVQLISLAQSVTWGLADWYIWGLLSPLVFALTRFTEFGRGRWPRDLAIHLVAAPVFALGQLFLYSLVYRPLGTLFWHQVGASEPWTVWTLYVDLVRGKVHAGVITYFLMAFLYFTLYYQARLRRSDEHRSQLASQLATSQLNALKMQLHPHFLFNTLNAITALIHSDPGTADRMTTRLGDLLRTTLELEQVQEVALERELQFLSIYLEIQSLRFSDRLRFEIDVSPDVREARVPVLLLQPLVENAVEHGVAPRAAATSISLQARRLGDELELKVSNQSASPAELARPHRSGGRGLANTRARLSELYGSRGHIEIVDDGIFCVTVKLPLRSVKLNL